MFTNNAISCPRCGGLAAIEDVATDDLGNIHPIRRAFTILNDASVDRSELERLREVLEQARAGTLTAEQATARATSINPSFRELVVPSEAGAFWQIIGVLVAIILHLLQQNDGPKIEINQTIINNFAEQLNAPERQAAVAKTALPRMDDKPLKTANRTLPKPSGKARTKGWKNSRCTCGTGLRSRECCGQR